jgi:hypothetical protein
LRLRELDARQVGLLHNNVNLLACKDSFLDTVTGFGQLLFIEAGHSSIPKKNTSTPTKKHTIQEQEFVYEACPSRYGTNNIFAFQIKQLEFFGYEVYAVGEDASGFFHLGTKKLSTTFRSSLMWLTVSIKT